VSGLKPGDLVMLIALSHVQYFCKACGADVRKYIGEVGEVTSGLISSNHSRHAKCGSEGQVHRVRFGDGFEETFRPEILRKIEPPKPEEVEHEEEELTV
jgi:hypothetical protein